MMKKILFIMGVLSLIIICSARGQSFIKRFKFVQSATALRDTLFVVDDVGNHRFELWKTDGTPAGTVMIKRAGQGTIGGIGAPVVFNNKLYFGVNDGINSELWQSDGTTAGTSLVKNLSTTHGEANKTMPASFTIFKGALYFVASQDGTNFALWKTNGTTAGTVRVSNPNVAAPNNLVVAGGNLYFIRTGYEGFFSATLWKTDGTTAGTSQVNVDDYQLEKLLNANGELVIFTSDANFTKKRLYKLQPGSTTPVLLHDYNANSQSAGRIEDVIAIGSRFFFPIRTVDAGNNGLDDLWASDGTAAGTVLLKSFAWPRQTYRDYMHNFVAFKNKAYFSGTGDRKLWTSDGTAGGTVKVADVAMTADNIPVVVDQKLYFSNDNALWSFDGTTAISELPIAPFTNMLTGAGGHVGFVTLFTDLWSNAPASLMQVTMNAQPLTNGSTSNFTSKADSSITAAVTVKNTGNKELVFSEISIAGNSFYVNGSPVQTVLPGNQTNFNLIYSPGKEEKVKGTLIIKSNSNGEQTNFSANLAGTATGIATSKTNIPDDGLKKSITFKDTIPDFKLSQNTVAENAAVNTVIGSFSANGVPGAQFSLTPGTGDADNKSFKIENGQLKTLSAFNFNTQSTYTIRVKAGDTVTSSRQKIFTVQVANTQNNIDTTGCGLSFQNLMYPLNDAVYVASRIIAVSDAGKILVSDNDGQQWRLINTGVATDFSQVRFTNSNTGYILGNNSILLKTENGGNSWFPLLSPDSSSPYLSNIAFPSATTGYAFGKGGVYKTIDGGRSWEKKYNSSANTLNAGWFLDENNGFICGSAQTLIHTTNGGNTWATISIPAVGANANLSSITFVNSTTGYISSDDGDVLQTKDSGQTWTRISTISANGATRRITFVNENTGYVLAGIIGGSGFFPANLFKTIDGGKNWAVDTGTDGALMGLAINNAGNKLCLVGSSIRTSSGPQLGSIILLKNGSANWETRSNVVGGLYYSGSLFTSGVGYAFGPLSIKTNDGGITWKRLSSVPDDYSGQHTDSYFINENLGFYGDRYSIYKTINGGGSWVKTSTDSTSEVQSIYFYNAQLGFYSNNKNVYRTADGGDTWSKVLSNIGLITAISFADQLTGYAFENTGKFYKTTDGGLTWATKSLGTTKYISGGGFFDTQVGLAGGPDGFLIRTTDGGDTWNPVSTPMLFYTTGRLLALDNTHGYFLNKSTTGGPSQIFESTDAGLTWNQIYDIINPIWGTSLSNGQLFLTGERALIKYGSKAAPAANAGYITGDTTIVVLNKMLYSVPAVSNTNYKWTVSGNASVEYQNNTATVAWKNSGQYTLQVTPYNSCGTGESRTLTVNVEDMPEPELTGPDSVLSHATNVVYIATVHDNNTYSFTATNSTGVSPAANKVSVNWGGEGPASVTVAEYSPRLNLKKTAIKNVVVKKEAFTLPENNFTVKMSSASCKGSNNGGITIKALQHLNYKAVVTGPGNFSKDYDFTDSLLIRDLAAGTYNACLSVTGNADFKRCYDANITEPKDLSLFTAINPATKILTLNLSGADSYQIELNGKHYQTNSTQFDVPLNAGSNNLKVYTDKLCQGIIQKIVNLNKITIFPNPFVDNVGIDLGGSEEAVAKIEISNAFGKLLYSKEHTSGEGKVNINTVGFDKGVYVLKLTLGQTSSVYKIVKQ